MMRFLKTCSIIGIFVPSTEAFQANSRI